MPAQARAGEQRRRLDQTLRRASRAATPRDGPQTSRVGNAAAGFAATRTRAPGEVRLASRLVRVCVRACERVKDDDLNEIKFKNLPRRSSVRRRRRRRRPSARGAAVRCVGGGGVHPRAVGARRSARGRCASMNVVRAQLELSHIITSRAAALESHESHAARRRCEPRDRRRRLRARRRQRRGRDPRRATMDWRKMDC